MKEIYTALITPFDQYQNIDYPATEKLITQLENEGQDGLVVLGTTGESSCLTLSEKLHFIHFVLSKVQSMKVIVGVGSNCTQQVIDMILQLNDDERIDGYLVVAPYYNKPTQEGLYQHFMAIDRVSQKAIYLYNVPKRCGVSIQYETILRLIQDSQHIIGLKQASDDLEMIRKLKKQAPTFKIYSGEDGLLLEGLEAGIDGIISVLSHLYGPLIKSVCLKYEQGQMVVQEDQDLKRFQKLFFKEASPAPMKYALSKRSLCQNVLRLPLVSISHDLEKEIDEII